MVDHKKNGDVLLPAFYFWFGGMVMFLVLLGFTVYNNDQQIKANTNRIDDIIEARTKDRRTATDINNWIEEFKRLNPDIKIPEYAPESDRHPKAP